MTLRRTQIGRALQSLTHPLLLLTFLITIGTAFSACSSLPNIPPITSVDRVAWNDLAGHPCETVTVKTNWYRGETATFCEQNGETMLVPTQHTDLTMMSGFAIGLGTLLSAMMGLI